MKVLVVVVVVAAVVLVKELKQSQLLVLRLSLEFDKKGAGKLGQGTLFYVQFLPPPDYGSVVFA